MWLPLVLFAAVACTSTPHAAPAPQASKVAPTETEDAGADLFFGPGYSFTLTAERGWICDCDGSQGVDGIYHPDSEDLEAAIYVAVAPRAADQTFDAYVGSELERLKQEAGGEATFAEEPSLTTSDERVIQVRSAGSRLSVAFVEEQKVFVALALSANDAASYERAAKAFRSLAASYHFLSENVSVTQ